jgi:heat shock protein HslJ
MKALTSSLLALGCLLLAACSSPPPDADIDGPVVDAGPAPADLSGGQLKNTRWHLISQGPLDAPLAIKDDPNRPAFIAFEAVDQRLAGSTGCNRFFGRYRLIGTAGFTIGQVGTTRVACLGAAKEQERAIIKILQHASFYGVNGDRLTIASADGQRLVFEPLAADKVATYRCDQGRLLNTSLSILTGHLTLRLPDGATEDLLPQPDAAVTTYANGLYQLQMIGDQAQVDDLTLKQQLRCTRQD